MKAIIVALGAIVAVLLGAVPALAPNLLEIELVAWCYGAAAAMFLLLLGGMMGLAAARGLGVGRR